MTTAATSLLGLALPVDGELSGTWGDVVNASLTSLLDTAIAGTTTLSSDTDVTLTTATLVANQARQAVLLCSGARTALRTITAPAQSKTYVVINATSGGYAVKIVGVGPTTGVSIAAGRAALVVWNGSDFIVAATNDITTMLGTLAVANGGTGATSITGLVKGNGTSAFTAAVSGTDYAPATSGSAILYGNGSGGFSAVTVGSGLTFSAGTLSGNTGTVTSVAASGGSTGLTFSGGPITGSGTLTLSGTLAVANGGTGVTTSTGSGANVLGTSPTIATPTITGNATVNGLSLGAGNASAANCTALGGSALGSNTSSGISNTAIGNNALYGNTSGQSNVAVGNQAAYNASTASSCTAVGASSLQNSTGSSNTAVGTSAGLGVFGSSTGTYNTMIGSGALSAFTTGYQNTAVGASAASSLTTGTSNVVMGMSGGGSLTTGTQNTYVGANTTASSSSATNEVVVGSFLTGKGSNTAYIGGSSGAYNQANSSSWSTTSDLRIKKNIFPVTDGLNVINALNPVAFDYIVTDKHDVGFIAQEYMAVLPDQVFKHAADEEEKKLAGEDEIYGVQRNLDPYFVSAIKSLAQQVEQLKAELAALKGGA
jgi:hypothetical protein